MRRHIYLLSLNTYVHFVEQNQCFVELFTSPVLGLAMDLLLDNETFTLVLKTQITYMNVFFAEKNPQRRKYVRILYFITYKKKEGTHFSETITIAMCSSIR